MSVHNVVGTVWGKVNDEQARHSVLSTVFIFGGKEWGRERQNKHIKKKWYNFTEYEVLYRGYMGLYDRECEEREFKIVWQRRASLRTWSRKTEELERTS